MDRTAYEVLAREADEDELAPSRDAGPKAMTALQLLQAVYRDPMQPQSVRIKTAGMAIAYETPKLSVGARVDHRGMGDMLEAFANAKHLEARREEPGPAVASAPAAPSFRRIVPAMATGDEATLDPPLRSKPG